MSENKFCTVLDKLDEKLVTFVTRNCLSTIVGTPNRRVTVFVPSSGKYKDQDHFKAHVCGGKWTVDELVKISQTEKPYLMSKGGAPDDGRYKYKVEYVSDKEVKVGGQSIKKPINDVRNGIIYNISGDLSGDVASSDDFQPRKNKPNKTRKGSKASKTSKTSKTSQSGGMFMSDMLNPPGVLSQHAIMKDVIGYELRDHIIKAYTSTFPIMNNPAGSTYSWYNLLWAHLFGGQSIKKPTNDVRNGIIYNISGDLSGDVASSDDFQPRKNKPNKTRKGSKASKTSKTSKTSQSGGMFMSDMLNPPGVLSQHAIMKDVIGYELRDHIIKAYTSTFPIMNNPAGSTYSWYNLLWAHLFNYMYEKPDLGLGFLQDYAPLIGNDYFSNVWMFLQPNQNDLSTYLLSDHILKAFTESNWYLNDTLGESMNLAYKYLKSLPLSLVHSDVDKNMIFLGGDNDAVMTANAGEWKRLVDAFEKCSSVSTANAKKIGHDPYIRMIIGSILFTYNPPETNDIQGLRVWNASHQTAITGISAKVYNALAGASGDKLNMSEISEAFVDEDDESYISTLTNTANIAIQLALMHYIDQGVCADILRLPKYDTPIDEAQGLSDGDKYSNNFKIDADNDTYNERNTPKINQLVEFAGSYYNPYTVLILGTLLKRSRCGDRDNEVWWFKDKQRGEFPVGFAQNIHDLVFKNLAEMNIVGKNIAQVFVNVNNNVWNEVKASFVPSSNPDAAHKQGLYANWFNQEAAIEYFDLPCNIHLGNMELKNCNGDTHYCFETHIGTAMMRAHYLLGDVNTLTYIYGSQIKNVLEGIHQHVDDNITTAGRIPHYQRTGFFYNPGLKHTVTTMLRQRWHEKFDNSLHGRKPTFSAGAKGVLGLYDIAHLRNRMFLSNNYSALSNVHPNVSYTMFYSDFMRFTGSKQSGSGNYNTMYNVYRDIFPGDVNLSINKLLDSSKTPLEFGVINAFVMSKYFLYSINTELDHAPKDSWDMTNKTHMHANDLLK